MNCPNCGLDFEPAVSIGGLTVHPKCGASIVIATGNRANDADVLALSAEDLSMLRKARHRPKRPAL